MSVEWSDARWCPMILRLPQFYLLVVALLSVVCAGFLFQRYRGVERTRTRATRVLAAVTLSVLGFAAAVQIFVGHDVQMYLLSSVTVACVAASVYWLSLAREGSLPSRCRNPKIGSNHRQTHDTLRNLAISTPPWLHRLFGRQARRESCCLLRQLPEARRR